MADQRISELAESDPLAADAIPLQRSTSNFKTTFTRIVTFLQSTFATIAQLNAHVGTGAGSAHPGGVTQTNIDTSVSAHDGTAGAHSGHFQNTSNPHATTADQVGAPDVQLGLKGELIGYDGGQHVRVPPASSNNQVLTSDTSEQSGFKFNDAQFFSPTQATGDTITRGVSGVDERVPIGAENQVYTVISGLPTWAASQSGGVTTFVGLTDTPGNYTGAALQVVRVNAAANALEFATASGGGNTTSPATHADDVLTAFDGINSQTLKATSLQPAAIAAKGQGVDFNAGTGFSGTAVTVSGNITIDPDVQGNYMDVTASVTISPPTVQSYTGVARVANGATVNTGNFSHTEGSQPAADAAAYIMKVGSYSQWTWARA